MPRIATYQKDPSNRVILVFYFSGHSDGIALELGRDRLAYADLRRWLASTWPSPTGSKGPTWAGLMPV